MEAFDLALHMGASHLERDVHLTRDDSLIMIHDDTVNFPDKLLAYMAGRVSPSA